MYNKYEKSEDASYRFIEPMDIDVRVATRNGILNTSLFMRILGIYLGAVLLMISLTVLSLKQLEDSIEHNQRFKTLNKLGIEKKEINYGIFKKGEDGLEISNKIFELWN